MNNETPLQKFCREMAQKEELELWTLCFTKWNTKHRLYKKYQARFILPSAVLKSVDKNRIGWF